MGNLLSGQAHDGKVVLPDGTVLELDRPTSVAELMLEHPRQYVLDLRSLSAGNSNAAPLPADHMLEAGKAYVMLPMAHGRATGLSAGEARRVLAAATRSMTKMQQPPCTRAVGVTESERAEWPAEEFEEGTEFFRQQHSSKRWKPSLGTIEEESLERKRQTQDMAGCNENVASQGEEVKLEKYGGIVPKKQLISKDHERAYFDSADWVLSKVGGTSSNTKTATENLKPKLKPTPHHQLPPRKPTCTSEREYDNLPFDYIVLLCSSNLNLIIGF
ncbi:unnamed protein product [Musa acuminata var. zebrina]